MTRPFSSGETKALSTIATRIDSRAQPDDDTPGTRTTSRWSTWHKPRETDGAVDVDEKNEGGDEPSYTYTYVDTEDEDDDKPMGTDVAVDVDEKSEGGDEPSHSYSYTYYSDDERPSHSVSTKQGLQVPPPRVTATRPPGHRHKSPLLPSHTTSEAPAPQPPPTMRPASCARSTSCERPPSLHTTSKAPAPQPPPTLRPASCARSTSWASLAPRRHRSRSRRRSRSRDRRTQWERHRSRSRGYKQHRRTRRTPPRRKPRPMTISRSHAPPRKPRTMPPPPPPSMHPLRQFFPSPSPPQWRSSQPTPPNHPPPNCDRSLNFIVAEFVMSPDMSKANAVHLLTTTPAHIIVVICEQSTSAVARMLQGADWLALHSKIFWNKDRGAEDFALKDLLEQR